MSVSGALRQIRDLTRDIEDSLDNPDTTTVDLSTMFVDPQPGSPDGSVGPSIKLGCDDPRHNWFWVQFALQGGGRVTLTDLIRACRKHVETQHG